MSWKWRYSRIASRFMHTRVPHWVSVASLEAARAAPAQKRRRVAAAAIHARRQARDNVEQLTISRRDEWWTAASSLLLLLLLVLIILRLVDDSPLAAWIVTSRQRLGPVTRLDTHLRWSLIDASFGYFLTNDSCYGRWPLKRKTKVWTVASACVISSHITCSQLEDQLMVYMMMRSDTLPWKSVDCNRRIKVRDSIQHSQKKDTRQS